LAGWSQTYYPELAQELEKHTGVDVEWTPSGLLFFGVDDTTQAVTWARNHQGVALESLDPLAARHIEPLISAELGQAVWMAEVAQVRNPRLLAAICIELRQSGVEFRENVEVTGFSEQQGKLVGIHTTAGFIASRRCLVASGAWSPIVLAKTGLILPIKPIKGQMLLLAAQKVHLKRMILKKNRYLIPRRDGRVLIGSTLEETGYEKSTTEAAQNDLLNAAIEMVPSLGNCPVERQWAGLRPGSPDGIPYIGEHPGISGLFVCTGHFRNGIVLGPASARLATDLMLEREPEFDLGQFRLVRP
jgi:glycine oxidase